ncbi:MAG: hypothetical protein KKF33_19120 [Alphaproteobacteria bacterium]|nr:hypothetical protein [Alphaproteobacteria bacterium]
MALAKIPSMLLVIVSCTILFSGSEQSTNNDIVPTESSLFESAFLPVRNSAADYQSLGLLLSAEVQRVRHGLWRELPDQRQLVGEHAMAALESLHAAPADLMELLDQIMLAVGLLDWMENDPAAPGSRLLSTLPYFLARIGTQGQQQLGLAGPRRFEEEAILTATAAVLLRLAKYEPQSDLQTTAQEILTAVDLKYAAGPSSTLPDVALEYLQQGLLIALRDTELGGSRLATIVADQAMTSPCGPVSEGGAIQWHQAVACSVSRRTPKPPAAAPLASSITPDSFSLEQGRLPLGRARLTAEHLVLASLNDKAGGVQIFRSVPFNRLFIQPIGDDQTALPVGLGLDSPAEFRAATVHGGDLYVVYYDNPSRTNYLLRARRASDGFEMVGQPTPLPSLEDPAGGTYEMIPQIRLFSIKDELHIVGGTLNAVLRADGILAEGRLDNCSRAVESVATPQGPVVLCVQKEARGQSAPFSLQGPEGVVLPILGPDVPYDLRIENGKVTISHAREPAEFAAMLRFDIERLNDGTLEYGIDNVEGRIPWSQIYYLNGFLDLLGLSAQRPEQWNSFGPLLAEVRSRLDMEVTLLDQQWLAGRFKTRAFSVDRSLQLFAVQTSRLLLLLERYQRELVSPRPIASLPTLTEAVRTLDGHIDQLRTDGQPAWWLPPGQPFLAWPKGSAFYFDGLNVPFNHQNEWAYSLLRTGEPSSTTTAMAIINHFLRRIAPDGTLPLSGVWDYWWGRAYDGWTEDMGYSINTPNYPGDHGRAWISFRSIDTMSMIAASPNLPRTTAQALIASAARLVTEGKVYPFVGYELQRAGYMARPNTDVARRYVRVSSPWELQNAAWAIDALLN